MAFGFGQNAGNACRVDRRGAMKEWANGYNGGSTHRRVVSRILWGVLALIAGCAAVATAAGATFAPAEIERISIEQGSSYTVNTMRLLYFAASATSALSCFGLWKASHRGGLGFWRSTARPALLGLCGTLVASGLVFANFFAMGQVQLAGLGAAALGATGFLFFWILRGPPFALQAGDAYWSRAIGLMFGLATLATSIGSVTSFRHWSKERYRFELDGPRFAVQEVARDRWNSHEKEMTTEYASYRVPQLSYSPTPIGSVLLAFLAVGCLSEMRYRRRLTGLARHAAFEKLF